MSKKKKIYKIFAVCMAFLVAIGVYTPNVTTEANAASTLKNITISFSHTITYGSGEGGYTNLKTTDFDDSLGERPVLCMQPAVETPPDGTYTVNKVLDDDLGTGSWNAIRNIVYYTPGYPGYNDVKDTWFAGYTRDEAIAIMHLAVSYARAGRPDNLDTWMGTSTSALPSRIWDKAKSIANSLWTDDENVSSGFKVLYVKVGSYQDMVCGYLNSGTLVINKVFLNSALSDGNSCYSKAGITFKVYDADDNSLVATCTTDKNGVVSPSELELDEGDYTIVESHGMNGYDGNGTSKTVTVVGGKTTTVTFEDYAQNDPAGILLEKRSSETNARHTTSC